MRENLKALYELQQLDTQVLEVERGASVIPEKIRELESELERLRAELGALNNEADSKRLAQREIESQINEETGKHKKWKRRLNEIKTPREYQALSRELEIGERQVHDFEESVMQIMTELEGKQKVIAEKDARLKEREIEVAAKVRELRIKQNEIQKAAQRIAVGRVDISKRIPEQLLKKYQQIRERKNGIGVSLVVANACSTCNVQQRPQFLIELRKYTSINVCPQCNRILVPSELVKPAENKDPA